MDTMQFFIYLLICAGVTYLIRMIPFVLCRGRLENQFVRSFLFYVPYAVLGAMTFPAIFTSTGSVVSRNDCGTDSFVSAERAFTGGCGGMCRSISDGTGPDAFIDKKSEGEDDYIQFMYDRKK